MRQIDPAEHSKALAELEERKKECVTLKAAKESAESQTKNTKTIISRLNKEVLRLKNLYETSKSSLEKTNKEIESLKKKNKSVVSEKEINELREEKKNATLELATTKQRVENLSEMLKKNRKRHIELQQKYQEVTQKEQDAKAALTKQTESHQALLKSYDSLKSSLKEKETKDQKEKQVPLVPSETSQRNTKESNSSKTVPPIPTIPMGGFKYAPSDSKKATDDSVSKKKEVKTGKINSLKENVKKLSKPVSEAQEEETKAASNKTQKMNSISESHDNATDIQTNMEQESSTSTQQKSKNPNTLKSKNPSLLKEANKATTNKNTESGKQILSEENNLREKLMKRKRELAKKIEAQNASKKVALSSSSDTPTAAPSESGTTKSDKIPKSNDCSSIVSKTENEKKPTESTVLKTNEVQSQNPLESKTNESKCDSKQILADTGDRNQSGTHEPTKEENHIKDKPGAVEPTKEQQHIKDKPDTVEPKKEQQDVKDKPGTVEPKKEQQQEKKDTSITMANTFGSGTTPAFGSGKTPVFGLNPGAKPFTSSFGVSTGKGDSSLKGGAFLDNLKPPGSSQTTQFVFGSSANIQLPKPSNTSIATPTFGSPFGSGSIFGGSFSQQSKKRALEVDNDKEKDEPSNKVTRLKDEEKTKVQNKETNNEVVDKVSMDTVKEEK